MPWTTDARFAILAISAAAILSAPAIAQPSNISPLHKYVWGENIGWLNLRDANAATQGVRILPSISSPRFLAGFTWSETCGWINTGDGTPVNGTAYANVNGTDFGVNILVSNNLAGLAWGENIGWINFNTAPTLAAFSDQARWDPVALRFRGYAWGENVGWINLDDATHYVGVLCPADFNADGFVSGDDFDAFVEAFAAGC